jgi:hypothetical protein
MCLLEAGLVLSSYQDTLAVLCSSDPSNYSSSLQDTGYSF